MWWRKKRMTEKQMPAVRPKRRIGSIDLSPSHVTKTGLCKVWTAWNEQRRCSPKDDGCEIELRTDTTTVKCCVVRQCQNKWINKRALYIIYLYILMYVLDAGWSNRCHERIGKKTAMFSRQTARQGKPTLKRKTSPKQRERAKSFHSNDLAEGREKKVSTWDALVTRI